MTKQEVLQRLDTFKEKLQELKRDISHQSSERINKQDLRDTADGIATLWVEELRSPLEHKFLIDKELIKLTSENMKRLHILSRPNNSKKSYLQTLNATLKGFDNVFILPIKQSVTAIENVLDLKKLVPALPVAEESDYLKEAIECANHGYSRAAIVMGWCSIIDKIQKRILALGLANFNQTSKNLKNQTSGKFKKWNKEFNISTISELQEVIDRELLVMIEGMNLIDGNQAERLMTCFQYRNHSAHPGDAPINDKHVVTFFSDIVEIVLNNPKFH